VLRSAGSRGATTLEISQHTSSMAVHSDLYGLKVNGYDIERIAQGKTPEGNKVNRYFLRHEPEHLAALLTGRSQTGTGTPLPTINHASAGPDTTPGQVGGGDYPLTSEDLKLIEDDEQRSLEGWA
jgi:hypothetical protein